MNNNQTGVPAGKHEHPLPREIEEKEKLQHRAAKNNAEDDMSDDVELTAGSPKDDSDEEEAVKRSEDNSDLI